MLYFVINLSCLHGSFSISGFVGTVKLELECQLRCLGLFVQDDVEKICLIYDHFLSNFPLCHGYWRKYAAHMARLCTTDKVVEVFEKAVSAATYSVGM